MKNIKADNWQSRINISEQCIDIFTENEWIASVRGSNQQQTEKHAKLIKATPDLLRACKAALMSLTSDEHYQEFKPLIMVLTDAVKKAGVK
jgi:hypothetical protein